MKVIEVQNLIKNYRDFRAVDGISFSIEEGSIFGFLGHNGAGKTTTIKALTGQLRPSSGSISVLGFDISKEIKEVHQQIGIVSEEQNLYKNLTVFQNIDFYRKLYNLPASRTDEIIKRLDLRAKKNVKTSELSKGLKQRVLIARSILHSPKILFLDEPTSGLDAHSAQSILSLIREMKNSGTTIFLTTHYLEEAEELCDSIAFISQGKIVKKGTPKGIIGQYRSQDIEISYETEKGLATETLSLTDKEAFRKIEEIREHHQLVSIHTQEKSLKDIFIELNQEGISDEV